MGNYITLEIELQVIKNFSDKTLELVDAEVSNIYAREEAGEFKHPDALSNALFVPMEREAIAIRAVFYEINTLVEWELHNLALKPYSKSLECAIPPQSEIDPSLEKVHHLRSVYDLRFEKVIRLIEEYYEINLSSLPGWIEFENARNMVNAFKHRKGFKDFRRDSYSKIPERFEPDRDKAYKVIEGARDFLKALWKKIEVKP